jgi:hypothetical protein
MSQVPADFTFPQIPDVPNNNFYGTEVKMLGWGQNGQTRINQILQIGVLKVLDHEDCLQRITALENKEANFDMREALCTVGDPYVIMTDVSN